MEENVHLKENIIISGKVNFGRNTSIHDDSRLFGEIDIGDNCLIAFNLFASTSKHNFKTHPFMPIIDQDILSSKYKKIIIEDDCWIGTNVVIMQGITIKKGSIIGANSVITKNIPPYSIVIGASNIIKKRMYFKPSYSINSELLEDIPYFYKGFFVLNYEKKRFGVQKGFLSKKNFVLKMDTYIIYNEDVILKIKIYRNDKLEFTVTEEIIIRKAKISED